MLAAPAFDLLPTHSRSRWRAVPVLLSVLVHLALAIAWLGFPLSPPQPEQPAAMAVELVAPPKASPAPTDKPAPAPSDQGQAIPQLNAGEWGEQSTAPAATQPADTRPDVIATTEKPKAAPKKPEPVTQNDRDFVLAQVVRHWKPPPELAARPKAEMSVGVTVMADGHFAETYDSRRPWNPAEVFDGYGALPPQSLERRTIDALYTAFRKAQPLNLPVKLKAKAPFKVRLALRFRDAR